MSDRAPWSIPDAAQVNIPGSEALDSRMRVGAGPWSEIREAMSCCTRFPTPAFRELLDSGGLDVRWPLAFAAWAWYRGATGPSLNQECAELLFDGGLLERAWALLEEYLGPRWLSDWRSAFDRSSLTVARRRGADLERYELVRDGAILGVVTRGPWDGSQGSWPEWGWLEPTEAFQVPGRLLGEEETLSDEVMRLAAERLDYADVVAQADRIQAQFMGPGVELVSLADGGRLALEELHLNKGRVYWR